MAPMLDVYPLYDVALHKGHDCYLFDAQGNRYLDLYGGHAVISIGHAHPHYVGMIKMQLDQLGFYSNSVRLPGQAALANKLSAMSGYNHYPLFMCNSGAEANENALKLASFATNRKKFIVAHKAFHGRTSLAVELTDNPKIQAPCNRNNLAIRVPLNDTEALKAAMTNEVAAIVLEGMQGVAGIYEPTAEYWQAARQLCNQHGALLIADEIQSGFGRTGAFFAHQHAHIEADMITMAKGMGNGFPVGGVLVSPNIEVTHGMLGTTFGGNPLAVAATQAVLDVLSTQELIPYAATLGLILTEQLSNLPFVNQVRGRGLMLGIELNQPAAPVRKALLTEHFIFTGSAAQPNTLRLLPPLTLTTKHIDDFTTALKQVCQ